MKREKKQFLKFSNQFKFFRLFFTSRVVPKSLQKCIMILKSNAISWEKDQSQYAKTIIFYATFGEDGKFKFGMF